MRKSPEVLRICQWLETPAGHRVAYGLVSISPVCTIVLDLVNHPETAMEVLAAGIIALCGLCMPTMFWVCGRSLIRAIDESVRQQQQNRQETLVAHGKEDEGHERKHSRLMRARQTVKMIALTAFVVCGKVTGLLLFAVCSRYGTATPLLLFALPMCIIPALWSILHIQLHAGRTKVDSADDGMTSKLSHFLFGRDVTIWRARPQTTHVVPLEE